MRTSSFRALNVESIEDRSLPSSGFFFAAQPFFFTQSHQVQSNDYASFASRSFESREFSAQGLFLLFNVRFESVQDSQPPSGFDRVEVTVGTPPTSQLGPVGNNGSDSGTNADSGQSAAGGSATVVHQPQVLARTPVANSGNVAMPVQGDAVNGTLPTSTTQAGLAAAQLVAQAGTPLFVQNNQISTPRVGGYNTAVVNGSDDMALPPGPSAVEAVPMTATTPPVVESEMPAEPVSVEPAAGFLPLDLSALRASATQFLDRVADLAPTWPDGMPSMTDSLWIAAAGLLGGAAVYSATNRPTRTAREAFGSATALSAWERRNARAAG